ncbi:hypothetical protein J6590_067953 [Homalodisca vitripennis]|nr:hypothetical protein J6590_067953 [Homalodisca vitripennis]
MPSLCSVCKNDLGDDTDSITCSGGCKCVFHLRCAGVTSEALKTRGSKKEWKDIVAELKNYGKQFEEFRESLQMFSDTIDKANENMKKLTENYKELKS